MSFIFRIAGISRSGVFFTNSISVMNSRYSYDLEHFRTSQGYFLPLTEKGLYLIEFLKECFEHNWSYEDRNKAFPHMFRYMILHVDKLGMPCLVNTTERGKDIVVASKRIPLPKKGFHIFHDDDNVVIALEELCKNTESYKTVLGHINNVTTNYHYPEKEITYLSFDKVRKEYQNKMAGGLFKNMVIGMPKKD